MLRIKSIALCVVLCFCFHVFVNAQDSEVFDDAYRALQSGAWELFKEGEYAACRAMLEKAMVQNANDAMTCNLMGLSFKKEKEFDKALQFIQKANLLSPEDLSVQYGLADVYVDVKQYDKAEELFVSLFEQEYMVENIFDRLFFMYCSIDDFDRAVEGFRTFITLFPDSHNGYIELAHIHAMQGMYDTAINILVPRLKLYPDDYDLNYRLGEIYKLSGDSEKAITYLKKAIKIDKKQADAYRDLGDTYVLLLHNSEKGFRYLKKAIALQPHDAMAYSQIANGYLFQKDSQSAMHWIDKGIENASESEFAYLLNDIKARVLSEYGNKEEAIQFFEKSTKTAKAFYACPYQGLGKMYKRLGHPKKAEENYLKVVNLEPAKPKGYFDLIDYYLAVGNIEAVYLYIERLSLLSLSDSEASLRNAYRGFAYLLDQRLDEAESIFVGLQEFKSSGMVAAIGLGHVYNARKEYTRARDEFEYAMTNVNGPFESLAYIGYGWVLANEHNHKAAIEKYKKVLKVDSHNMLALMGIGNAYNWLRQYDEAEKSFMIVLGDDPDNEYALAELGTVYLNRGEYGKSEELLKKSLAINNVSYSCPYEGLGLLYLQRGEEKKAKEFFSKAISINPDVEYRKYNGLAKIYIKRKQYEKARQLLKKALENYPHNQKARELLAEIDQRQEQLHAEDTIAFLTDRYEDNPSDVDVIVSIAHYYESVGDYDATEVFVAKGLALDHENAELYYVKGWNDYHKGELRKAITSFKQGNAYDADVRFIYGIASMYRYLADLDMSNYWVRNGKTLYGGSFLLCYAEGMNLFEVQRYEEAYVVFKRGISLNELHLDNYEGVIRTNIEMQQYDEARDWITKAKSIASDNRKILNAEAELFVRQGAYSAALESYLKATKVSVNDVCTYHGLAHVYRQLGDLKRSESSLEIANLSDPLHGNMKFAKYYFDSGDFSRATEFCDTIINNNQNLVYVDRAFFIKGLIDWYKGNDAEALKIFGETVHSNDQRLAKISRAYWELLHARYNQSLELFFAIGTDDSEVNSFIFLGIAHAKAMMHDDASAVYYYKKVLNADAYNLWALIGIGQVYVESGDYEEVTTILEDARKVYGDNAYILSQLGMVELNRGNHKEAEELLTLSLDNNSENLSCPYEGLGLLYLMQNDALKAEKMFKTAISINPDDEYKKYNGLAKIYLEKKQYDQAIVLLEKSLSIESENNEADGLLRLAKLNMNG